MDGKIFIKGLKISCVIGTLPRERKKKQTLLIDLEFPAPVRAAARKDDLGKALDYQKIADRASKFVSQSRFYLIETLAERLAATLLKEFKLRQLTLRVHKPNALRNARNVGVEICRK